MLSIDSKPMLERTRKAYELLIEDEKLQIELKVGDLLHHQAEIECAEEMIRAIDYNLTGRYSELVGHSEKITRNQ